MEIKATMPPKESVHAGRYINWESCTKPHAAHGPTHITYAPRGVDSDTNVPKSCRHQQTRSISNRCAHYPQKHSILIFYFSSNQYQFGQPTAKKSGCFAWDSRVECEMWLESYTASLRGWTASAVTDASLAQRSCPPASVSFSLVGSQSTSL